MTCLISTYASCTRCRAVNRLPRAAREGTSSMRCVCLQQQGQGQGDTPLLMDLARGWAPLCTLTAPAATCPGRRWCGTSRCHPCGLITDTRRSLTPSARLSEYCCTTSGTRCLGCKPLATCLFPIHTVQQLACWRGCLIFIWCTQRAPASTDVTRACTTGRSTSTT
jgi:hypothetical protein